MLYSQGLVWIEDEGVYGKCLHYGAYFSTIAYAKDGMEYEVLMENDEFTFIGPEDEDDSDD